MFPFGEEKQGRDNGCSLSWGSGAFSVARILHSLGPFQEGEAEALPQHGDCRAEGCPFSGPLQLPDGVDKSWLYFLTLTLSPTPWLCPSQEHEVME